MTFTELQLQDQIYAIWLPLAITLAFGVIGVIRGVLREGFVAASVVLATAINFQWAGQWAEGMYGVYNGISQRDQQFIVSIVVLWLVVLVVGYGLGSLLPKTPVSTSWRLFGGLMGFATGAAMAGWTLRYFIMNTNGTLAPGLLVEYPVSRLFMIWAGWFPLVLALVATLLVIIVPLRRAQSAVAQPSAATDWTPSAAPAAPVATAATMAAMAPTAAMPMSGPPYVPPPPIPAARSDYPTEAWGEPDAPPTSLLPQSEMPTRAASTGGMYNSSSGGGTATRRMETVSPSPPADSAQPESSPYATSSFSTGSDSSWLVTSTQDESKPAASEVSEASPASPAYGVPGNVVPVEGTETSAATTGNERKCSNCGSPLAPGAVFCTECGKRVE